MARQWTLQQRQQQAQIIRRWEPWKHASGPRTPNGKATSCQNAWKGASRPLLRQLARQLKEQRRTLRELVE